MSRMTSRSKLLRRSLREYSPRDLLVIGLPLLLLVLAGFWLASRFIEPAPKKTLVLSTGGEGGAYQRFGATYKDTLARYGIEVIEKPSAGSTENLLRLRDTTQEIDAAFVQGGTARVQEDDTLLSLGGLYNEPLWIFYRAGIGTPTRLADLKGMRVAIDSEGSGTRYLAQELLHANRIDATNTRLLAQGGLGLGDALTRPQDRCGLRRRSDHLGDRVDAAAHARHQADEPCSCRRLHPAIPLSVEAGAATRRH